MVMIVPRHRAGEYLAERRRERRPWHCIERRRTERRTGQFDGAFGVVIFLR